MKIKILIISIFTFFLLTNVSKVFAAEYTIEDYTINATIQNNGDIKVEELLKYEFYADMNGVYRDIIYGYKFESQLDDMKPTSSRYQATGIEDIKVYTSDYSFDYMDISLPGENLQNGMSNVYSLDSNQTGRKTIKAYSPVSYGSDKYVKYEYTIKDAVVKYSDAYEFYWNFLGGDWACYINNVNINVSFEGEVKDIQAYPHTYANIEKFNVENNKINLNVTNIFAGTAVDIRASYNSDMPYFLNKTVGENYDYEAVASIEKQMSIDKGRQETSGIIHLLIFVIYIISGIYIVRLFIKTKYGKIKSKNDVEPNFNLLNTYSIGKYNLLRNLGNGSYSNPNVFIATFLDLVNRKYVKMNCSKIANKGPFTVIEYKYFIAVDINKDFNLLSEYERRLLNYLFNEKSSDEITVGEFENNEIEFNERLEKLKTNTELQFKFAKFCLSITKAETEEMFSKIPKKVAKTITSFLILLPLLWLINIFIVGPYTINNVIPYISVYFFIHAFFATFISIGMSLFRVIKDEYVEEYNKLIGIERYLKEYSKIKERYPIEIVLWEKYLVFATIFGIAKKVSSEFKEELLKNGYDTEYINSNYPMIYMTNHSDSFISSVSSATFTSSDMGSSSSGGFSGGGSGGGGRWWWRRRSFLNKKALA